MEQKSKGHITFNNGLEYYQANGEVYRAPIGNVFDGEYRIGRWECTITHFERFKNVILLQEDKP